MTVKEKTICKMIQAFPVLLILAQKHEKCLDTPFTYHPPHPTHSTDYYEALEALFHTLSHQSETPEQHPVYDCDSFHSYGKGYYGPSHKPCPGYQHHGTKYPHYSPPTYTSGYPQFGPGYQHEHHKYPDPNAGTLYGINTGINFKTGVHNRTGTGQKGYAPTQVYTGTPKIKFKVVVKKNKITGQHRRVSEKLQKDVTTDRVRNLNGTLSTFDLVRDDVVEDGGQKWRKDVTLVEFKNKKGNNSSKQTAGARD